MLNIGDDFTHIWFSECRSFLSMKKIKAVLAAAKEGQRPIELNQTGHSIRIFISHEHENSIFIGPYKRSEKQNLALFVREGKHMVLAHEYHKKNGEKYTKKSKGMYLF